MNENGIGRTGFALSLLSAVLAVTFLLQAG